MLAGFERGYGRPKPPLAAASRTMRDDGEDDEDGGFTREGDLERLMRSLSEDMTTSKNQSSYGFEQKASLREFSPFGMTMFPPPERDPFSGSSFSQSQPMTFPTDQLLLSMASPPSGILQQSALLDGRDEFSQPQRVPQDATFWDSLPESMYMDSIDELLSTPSPWDYQGTDGSLLGTPAAPLEKPSHYVARSPLGPTSPSSPTGLARLNSVATASPNSSMSSESFSDNAAEDDHSHHGVSSSSSFARPSLYPPPSPSGGIKRKTPDRAVDERCDKIQSLISNPPSASTFSTIHSYSVCIRTPNSIVLWYHWSDKWRCAQFD